MDNETTADALRTLADLLEANPDLMDKVGHMRLLVPVRSPDEMARYASMIGGHRRKTDTGTYFGVKRVIGPRVSIEVFGAHYEMCTRKVVGTETVELPAVEAQPARTEVREIVEWVCPPVLDRTEASA